MMHQWIMPNLDEDLRGAILKAFAADNSEAFANIRVGVLNGIAHLAGKVDSLSKRTAAEEIAKLVPGVRGVVNRIESPGGPSPARTINLNLEEEE